jgi:hypothetical protein
MPSVTLAELKKAAHEIDPALSEDDEDFKIMMILLASAVVGPYSKAVARFCGYTEWFVRKYAGNLRRNKIWYGKKIRCDWFDEHGALALLLDVGVAKGWFEKIWEDESGKAKKSL